MQPDHASFDQADIRLSRRFWLSLFSLCVACLFFSLTASRAEATCGDYLGHHGDMSFGHGEMPGPADPTNDVPSPKRCNGPSCRQAPLQSPAPVPVVTFETQDRWVMLTNQDLGLVDGKSFLAQFNEPAASPMIAFRLDRPPKA